MKDEGLSAPTLDHVSKRKRRPGQIDQAEQGSRPVLAQGARVGDTSAFGKSEGQNERLKAQAEKIARNFEAHRRET
jgi:hypothetical protein